MELTRHIVYLGRAAREKVRIKVRQPLYQMEVKLPDSVQQEEMKGVEDIIKDELNIKEIIYLPDRWQAGKEKIEEREGVVIEEEKECRVALNTNLTQELIEEGFAREFVHKIQILRKEAGFEVIDRIRVFYEAGESLNRAIENYRNYISQEILSVEMEGFRESGEQTKGMSAFPPAIWRAGGRITKELKVNGEPLKVSLERMKQ